MEEGAHKEGLRNAALKQIATCRFWGRVAAPLEALLLSQGLKVSNHASNVCVWSLHVLPMSCRFPSAVQRHVDILFGRGYSSPQKIWDEIINETLGLIKIRASAEFPVPGLHVSFDNLASRLGCTQTMCLMLPRTSHSPPQYMQGCSLPMHTAYKQHPGGLAGSAVVRQQKCHAEQK